MPSLDFGRIKNIARLGQAVAEVAHLGQVVWQLKLPVGGIITNVNIGGDNYRIHTFLESGDFVSYDSLDVEYFIVGGGGSGRVGGNAVAKGGGAGGRVRHNFDTAPMSLVAGTYAVVVGDGGVSVSNNANNSGQASTFNGITAEGGQGVGNVNGGDQGGSGGKVGGAGIAAPPATAPGGGGGAGDGENGHDAIVGFCGDGGVGSFHNPDGDPRYFAGGGGGQWGSGGGMIRGVGGLGGGSEGSNSAQIAATPNTGGGSGGARQVGGSGGSGIVIIRYKI